MLYVIELYFLISPIICCTIAGLKLSKKIDKEKPFTAAVILIFLA